MAVISRGKKIIAQLVLAGLLFIMLAGPALSQSAQAAWHTVTTAAIRRHYLTWPSAESAYFHVRYAEQDAGLAAWLVTEAEHAVREVQQIIPHESGEKPWLVVVPDQDTFKRAFGWGEGTGALGVYLADTIKVLSPRAWDWVPAGARESMFAEQGPLVHEYTHYVLDTKARGNYTRWFSEGLAQWVEYQVLGYEWVENSSSLRNGVYRQDELDRSFDSLPDALAYRQALSLVTYLETLQGRDGLNRFINLLGNDIPFYRALEQVYDMDRSTFYQQWEAWYVRDARWFMAETR